MTRYWLEFSDTLLAEADAGKLDFPEGFRLTGRTEWRSAHTTDAEVEDDHAPAELEGRLVEVTFQSRDGGRPVIATRELA